MTYLIPALSTEFRTDNEGYGLGRTTTVVNYKKGVLLYVVTGLLNTQYINT